jgi:UDP-N-acetylglucosamine acyltransferase
MRPNVHPTAIIEEGAQLATGCVIHAHAHISRYVQLGEGVVVHPFAVIGGDPQDLSFDAAIASRLSIGARTVIREHVTINRGAKSQEGTRVGCDCFLMAGCHIAHDCHIGDRVVIANAVLLAGHVQVADRAFLGGGAVVHQFCRIGEGVMIGGGARVSRDVAPYCMVTERNALVGLNVVGLRRRGVDRQVMAELKRAYHALDVQLGNLRQIAASMLATDEFNSAEVRNFLQFFAGGRRQFVRSRRGGADDQSIDD